MGKIFRIIGNFEQDGKWAEPRPNFVGKIAADDNGEFYGYCDELYDSDQPDINKVRYLYGKLQPFEGGDGNGYSIFFIKLSNYCIQTPLLYHTLDNSKEDSCFWAVCHLWFPTCFTIEGRASLQIEDLPYSEKEWQEIRKRFSDEIDLDNNFLSNISLATFAGNRSK